MYGLVNIHTHLIPAMIWIRNHFPRISTSPEDLPSLIFTSSALFCLSASVIWHTMSGCAHRAGMVMCARMDYVGIGWLISASVGTVAHYGLYCHETQRVLFLSLCAASAVLGSVFPFMDWFNKFEFRVSVSVLVRCSDASLMGCLQLYRISFFLGLAFSAVAPLASMAYLYGFWEMISFISEHQSPFHPPHLSHNTSL